MGAMEAVNSLGASTVNDDSAELDLEMKERCSNHLQGVQQPAEEDRIFPLDGVVGTDPRRADGLVGHAGGIGAAMSRRRSPPVHGTTMTRTFLPLPLPLLHQWPMLPHTPTKSSALI